MNRIEPLSHIACEHIKFDTYSLLFRMFYEPTKLHLSAVALFDTGNPAVRAEQAFYLYVQIEITGVWAKCKRWMNGALKNSPIPQIIDSVDSTQRTCLSTTVHYFSFTIPEEL